MYKVEQTDAPGEAQVIEIANEKPITVEVQDKVAPAACGSLITFTTYAFLFALNCNGVFGAAGTLSCGIVQVCLFILFLIGSLTLIKVDPFGGNMQFVFAGFFGMVGGVTNIIGSLAPSIGLEFNGEVVAVVNLIAGVLLLCTLPGIKRTPWTAFTIFALAGIALVLFSVGGFGVMPATMFSIAGYIFGIVGVLGLYTTIAVFNGFGGVNMPMGKPFFK